MERRQLFILVGVGIVVLTVVLIINYLKKADQTVTLEANQLSAGTAFPYTADGRTLFFYDTEVGKFAKRLLPGGAAEHLSDFVQYPSQVAWSPNGDQVIFSTLNTPSASIENPFFIADRPFESENFWLLKFGEAPKLMKAGIKRIGWTPSGEKILYHFVDEGGRVSELNLANPDASGQLKLKDFRSTDLWFVAVDEQSYTYSEVSQGQEVVIRTLLGLERKVEFPREVVFSELTQAGEELWVYTSFEGGRKFVYRYQAPTGAEQKITVKAVDDIDRLFLASDGRTLYFTSEEKLYKLDLPE